MYAVNKQPKLKIVGDYCVFSMEQYYKTMTDVIVQVLTRPEKTEPTYDLLDTDEIIHERRQYMKLIHMNMKNGEIWQKMIGNYDGFVDLTIGHSTGLDIMSETKKIVIELKNRTNTDNASSRKSNLQKLADFKKLNPDYLCVYGTINDSSESKTKNGRIINHKVDGVEIYQYIGFEFLNLVFGDNTEEVIQFVRRTIDEFRKNRL